MERTLNIDIHLIKRYADNKRRKELFAFAIWCHIQRVNAVVYGITNSKLRKKLSIGKAKAERIIADAADDPLFEVNGTIFRVGSFRDKTIKYTRKQHRYQSALVKTIKFDTKVDYSLKYLYDLINETLAIFPITATEDKDCLQQRGGHDNRYVQTYRDAKSRTLTLKKFSQNLKMSISSCSRILKNLMDDGKINKTPSILFSIIDSEHKEQIQEVLQRLGLKNSTYERNGLQYVVVPCSYSIAMRDVSNSYKHKIYNYHKSHFNRHVEVSTIPQLCGY